VGFLGVVVDVWLVSVALVCHTKKAIAMVGLDSVASSGFTKTSYID
jgi:hypothetical protein